MELCRIILVDDHSLFRSGMRGLLDRYDGIRVVGEASTGEEFLAMLPATEADVVFMDFAMPGMNGRKRRRKRWLWSPDSRSLPFRCSGMRITTRGWFRPGPRFLMKDSPMDEVLRAIETVAAGGTYFCEEVLRSLASRMQTAVSGYEGSDERLSTREIEILVCVCRGLSNQEIADELFISKRTVDKHRANILEKTGCKNTASLVVYAIRKGIVEI